MASYWCELLVTLLLATLGGAVQGTSSGTDESVRVQSATQHAFYLNVGGDLPTERLRQVAPLVQLGRIKILTTYFGAYPCIGCGGHIGKWCNGGLPQLANLSYHRETMQRQMATAVPTDFDGYIVHDYEAWSVPFAATSTLYRNASIALARSQSPPGTPEDAIVRLAEESFNQAALEFLTLTINTTKELRPQAIGVGFYGYPHHTYWGGVQREHNYTLWNDELLELWHAQTALFPSIYLPYGTRPGCTGPGCANASMQNAWVDGGMNESLRISKHLAKERGAGLPILPYTWYRYHDGEPKGLQLLSNQDTELEFLRPFDTPGVEAVIIWGSEKNETDMQQVIEWFETESHIFGGNSSALIQENTRKVMDRPAMSVRHHATVAFDTHAPIPSWQPCGL